ncbi:hypothetical protein [Shewanella sp.]|uniref:hypothetical protein n=1 Tax=Shewanella sp. TaxID=50422 RepID=UPI003F39F6C5
MIPLIVAIAKDIGMATATKIAWKMVSERFFTRAVIYGLEKLKDSTENDVVDGTVEDIINSLRGKNLDVIDQMGRK